MKVRHIGEEVPGGTLRFFEEKAGVLFWAGAPPEAAEGFRKERRAPWGQSAGGQTVAGHGHIVRLAGMILLSGDILYALKNGAWPWQVAGGEAAAVVPVSGVDYWRTVVRARWSLTGGVVVWKEDRAADHPAGSPALGTPLSGFRAPVVSTGGMGFLLPDIKACLQTGYFPFELYM